jgi:hypothetical protein
MDDKFIVESLHLLQGRLNAEKKTIYIMSEEGVPK